ncbi:HCN2, partial [Symbiodinium necroappetens]
MESARHMQEHWDVYQKGADQLTRDLLSLFSKVPESFKKQYQEVSADTLKSAQDLFYSLLGNIVNNVSSLILGVLLTMLYTLFWLCSPVPMDSSVDVMFRKYIMFKTLACFGYGISAGLLLYFLSVDLASVFALTTFALNFVPEVGPFIAMVLPCPVIILDSRIDRPMLVLFVAILGQLALKFAFSNIIE